MPASVNILSSPADVSEAASEIVAELVRAKPDAVLGLSTGSSPIATYERLVQMHRDNGLSFSQITTFNLDEYVGLCGSHDQSYRAYMHRHLFDHIDITTERTHIPDGCADNLDVECEQFEQAILDAGGADIWLLGIGRNGHIAFNEPGSPPDSRTRRIVLTRDSIEANSRFFDHPEEVPREALTAGIATILDGRRLLLIATGEAKAAAVRTALEGPIDPSCPASYLQTHPDSTFLLDEAAANLLRMPQV
jgi:glucosamine-6-phosphate deaminase